MVSRIERHRIPMCLEGFLSFLKSPQQLQASPHKKKRSRIVGKMVGMVGKARGGILYVIQSKLELFLKMVDVISIRVVLHHLSRVTEGGSRITLTLVAKLHTRERK